MPVMQRPLIAPPGGGDGIHFRSSAEVAIASVALPPGVGIRGPRDFNGNARAVTDRVLGVPPDVAAAIQNVPRIPFDPGVDPPLTGRLYSHVMTEGSARAPVYLTQLRIGGSTEFVAIKLYPPGGFTPYQHSEVLHGTILGELGVAPRVLGLVEINGRTGMVMEPVAGDFPELIPAGSRAIQDLQVATQRMQDAGVAIGDFQYFITPEGRAVLIDPGGTVPYTDPSYSSFAAGMSGEIGRLAHWNVP